MAAKAIQQQQMPVFDLECEKSVIGTILSYGNIYDHVRETLDDECFHDGKMLAIWQAMGEVRKRSECIDIITVSTELAKEGSNIQPWEVTEVSSCSIGTTATIDYHTSILKEKSIRRRLWRLGQKLIEAGVAETEDINDIQQKATEELNGLYGTTNTVFTLTEALMSLSDIITNNLRKGSRVTGTPTGFRRLDEKGGLHQSDLVIIGGESSHGKSSLLMAIIKNAAEKGEPVAIYSLEMTKEQLAARLVSMKSGVPASDIMYSGDLQPTQIEMIDTAKSLLPGGSIYFDDESTSNIDTILLSIRKMKMLYNIKGAAVDYLQILSVNSKTANTREQQMGDAARRLKNLAKELDIWIIALSQLSRNSQEPEPSLNRLRDSGQIAEAADVVMFVYRPSLKGLSFPYPFENVPEEDVENRAMISVAKGRNIGVFKFLVEFNAETTHFTDMDLGDYNDLTPVEEEAPF